MISLFATAACATAASPAKGPGRAALAATPGGLMGIVEDSLGEEMADVTVLAVSQELGATSAGFTDGIGFYQISNLLPGTYRVTFARGQVSAVEPGVVVRAGEYAPLNAVLAASPNAGDEDAAPSDSEQDPGGAAEMRGANGDPALPAR